MPRIIRWLAASVVGAASIPTTLPAQSAPAAATRSLRVGGDERSYLLQLPPGHRRDHAVPLLLVFHGGGGRGAGMARHTGFGRLAAREGFVVVYPDGLDRRWNDGRGYGTAHDDVAFVRALLDTLRRELSIDPRRIYATGISNGAMFAYRLACDLPGVLAAIAPVAGATPADLTAGCAGTAPVSVLAMQGTADPLLPYAGGGVARGRGRVLSAAESIAFWAKVAGCADPPAVIAEPDRVRDGTRVRLTAYGGCPDGRGVELYTVQGGGHTWPGGPPVGRLVGRVSRELDATAVIWEFFARHARGA
jgi:polyhydroxybutyrate depolymerase